MSEDGKTAEELEATIQVLEDETDVLRNRLQDRPDQMRRAGERILELRGRVAQAAGQNESSLHS